MSNIYVAFYEGKCIAEGSKSDVILTLRKWVGDLSGRVPLIFDLEDGKQVDFDLSQEPDEAPKTSAGRPKLGVVPKEITLLPRQWEWLEQQPGGTSAALRRLVDDAKKREGGAADFRRYADAACRFMSAIAGNLSGYEAATRALYAKEPIMFEASIINWPNDIRRTASQFGKRAFDALLS